jgi:hypothetical protein
MATGVREQKANFSGLNYEQPDLKNYFYFIICCFKHYMILLSAFHEMIYVETIIVLHNLTQNIKLVCSN